MDRMKKRIFIKDWLAFKPYEKQTSTDSYYLRICNEVNDSFHKEIPSFMYNTFLDDSQLRNLICFLTSYFEDIISGTNIWNTFVKLHERLYKKPLPLYEPDEYYYEEEINQEDVYFLTWYFLNTIQEEKFIPPYNEFILLAAEVAYDVFDEAWEVAPENNTLRSYYQIDKNEEDYYIARHLIDNILFNTYLFHPDTFKRLDIQLQEIIDENEGEREDVILALMNETRDGLVHTACTALLGMKGKEWAAEILGSDHPLYRDFLNMSPKIEGMFLYKGQDKRYISIEHIASGKKFQVTQRSFEYADSLKEVDTILYMGITQWKNEWWFSGIFFQQPFNADLILKEKNSLESRRAVSFLDHTKKVTKEALKTQFQAFLDINNGSQMAFMLKKNIDDFFQRYTRRYQSLVKLTEKERKASRRRARKEGFSATNEVPIDIHLPEDAESCLVFFNPKSGVEVAYGVNNAFPLPNNPFFDADHSREDIMFLLSSEEISTELAMFCIDHCKDDLDFFQAGFGKLLLEDLDFMLRFWKKEHYFSKPSITFAGQPE